MLIGKADTIYDRRIFPDWVVEMMAATDAALLETLGEQQLATLTSRGAALEITDAVTYLRGEADRALTSSVAP